MLTRTPIRKPRKPLNRMGPKGRAWAKARWELKREFAAMGVQTCEARFDGCRGDDWLSFAHTKKRRHLKAGEIKVAALLCTVCHDRVELLGEARMQPIIEGIIAARELR